MSSVQNTVSDTFERPLFDAFPSNGRRMTPQSDVLASPSKEAPQKADEPDQVIAPALAVQHKEPVIHFVAGEPFAITRWEGEIVLRRKYWSLNGRGRTLAEAETDLIMNARDIASVYLNHPVHLMTLHAVELRDFILRVL